MYTNMEKDCLEEFVKKAVEENEKKEDDEKRKKHFKEIGRQLVQKVPKDYNKRRR